jgi:diguanylate cyclase (GGDEF)-like protein
MFNRLILALLRRPAAMSGRELRVYFDLVDHLYNELGAVAGGVVGIMTLAAVSYGYDADNFFLEIMALVGIVGFGRLASITHYRRHHLGRCRTYRAARRWELYYAMGAVSFAFVLGVFGVLVAADPKTDPLEILVTASVVGYAGGIAGRNAGRPVVAISQVIASCLPLFVYSVWAGGGVNIGIAIMLAIYSATLIKIVVGLQRMVSKAFQTQRDVGEVNAKLDTAIAHMKSGLCMVDAEGNIQILNQRTRELLRLPDTDYEKLHEVLVGALSAGSLHHADVEAIQKGAAERSEIILNSVAKDGMVLTLKAAMTPAGGYILSLDDITEQSRAAADIERMAKFDSLTGLANRVTIMTTLGKAISDIRSLKADRQAAVLLIDLDKFKEINDTLGHDVGDQLLMKVADRLLGVIPESATVGRLGGDEFIVIAPAIGLRDASALADRINRAIAKPTRLKGQMCSTTASIGISLAGDHGNDPADLIKAADIALYARKGSGRNGYDVFDAEMARGLARRRQLEHDLAVALQSNGLALAFQPIVSAAEGHKLLAFETLARWTHAELGVIAPDEFIPIAESTGMIAELGRYVLLHACKEAINWPEDISVSVNVSAIQLRNREQLFDDIWSALTASGLSPKRLDLEMTESVLIEDADGVQELIEALRKMDISISLDDFGTGYSSLAYVQNYRFDKIKLDKAFARNIETDHTTRATIAALASIAAATGSRLLLEGVETAEQARFASLQGVHELQGYYFSKPISGEQVIDKIIGKLDKKYAA